MIDTAAAPIFSADTASSLLADAPGIAVVALPCLGEKSQSRAWTRDSSDSSSGESVSVFVHSHPRFSRVIMDNPGSSTM